MKLYRNKRGQHFIYVKPNGNSKAVFIAVDGVVKTIFLSFLDAVPEEESVAEGERKEPVGRLELPLRGSTNATRPFCPLECQDVSKIPFNSFHGIHNVPHEGSCIPMNKDGVSTAFELISEEIESLAEGIAQEGAKAFKDKNYSDAQELAETGENLMAFKIKVDQLLEEWENGFDQVTRTKTKIKEITIEPKGVVHTKSKKTRLSVKFKDGTEVLQRLAADTFVDVLTKIGLTKVESLSISVRGVPLVGDMRSGQYQQRRVSGRYVVTHSSTAEKAEILKEISKRFGVGLTVDIV